MTREYTTKLLEMIKEGLLNRDVVIMACVNYMSEDDIRDMMDCNGMLLDEGDEEEEPEEEEE
jgi:hypothetical protein